MNINVIHANNCLIKHWSATNASKYIVYTANKKQIMM